MQDKVAMPVEERAIKCAAFALDKKALNVKVLNISRISSIADFLVLASGRSDRQVQAIADSVKQGLKPFDHALDTEGYDQGRWVVVDYGDVIVHVFQEEVRALYNLDELWNRAAEIEIPDEFQWENKQA
ncbi:ribosome silencing factor [Geomonas sp. Red32]|uniref:ribosome silencing factor n=1 Tax=Geomonas sp. Red32 TaxID=2912856 RepID=UPI00202CBA2E|nr:ribosome silencing factor [Geomonas sp. Red32]MCM0081146.1 ribosome silencing factor [Geomonas sp. Red32]